MLYTIIPQERHLFADLLYKTSMLLEKKGWDKTNFLTRNNDTTYMIYSDYVYGICGLAFFDVGKAAHGGASPTLRVFTFFEEMASDEVLLLTGRFLHSLYDSVYALAQDRSLKKILLFDDDGILSTLDSFQWPFVSGLEGREVYVSVSKRSRAQFKREYGSFFASLSVQIQHYSNVVFLEEWLKTKHKRKTEKTLLI